MFPSRAKFLLNRPKTARHGPCEYTAEPPRYEPTHEKNVQRNVISKRIAGSHAITFGLKVMPTDFVYPVGVGTGTGGGGGEGGDGGDGAYCGMGATATGGAGGGGGT